MNLLNLARFRTPAKNAVEKELDESMEWPTDVPYEEWEEDMLQTAYATMFGLYFFNTPAKDLMRWLGKDEPKNYRFVNAMNRHETALNVSEERTRLREADGPLPWKKKQKRMYVSDEEILGTGDVLRFCQEKEDTAFGIFMTGTFAMMMPGKDINRKGMVSSRDNAKLVYQAAKTVNIPIIGMGGIDSAEDAIEFIMAGATAVAVGTANFRNPSITAEIVKGIEEFMICKGIEDISEIRGCV